jgi:pantothenate kinase
MSNFSSTGKLTAELDYIVAKLRVLDPAQRFILGITGYPAAGKSTVSKRLADAVNERLPDNPAIVVPMDGFHLPNDTLRKIGLLELKGVPDTFDAQGFVELLHRLRDCTTENVYCPLFDRSIEASIENAIVIEPAHRLCVVEGNYLLLDREPWNQCREYFDEVWFLDVAVDTILPRLYERHERGGRSKQDARAKVESTDLPNARLIEVTKNRANRLI